MLCPSLINVISFYASGNWVLYSHRLTSGQPSLTMEANSRTISSISKSFLSTSLDSSSECDRGQLKNNDWLHNINPLAANRIRCQAILRDQNSSLPHAVQTLHHWQAMTINGNLSLPVQQTSQLSSYCFFTIYARSSVVEGLYSSKLRYLNWSIILNIILLWSFVPISWGTQQKTFPPRHLRYMDLRSWGAFIVNFFPAGLAVMKAWNNIVHSILWEHPRLDPLW